MKNTANDLIEEAKQRIDLLQYIEHATCTKAKRRSSSYVIDPCPFCGRKNHFYIRPEMNYYHTFSGCGKSGTIIDFLMEYEGLSLHEAIKKTLQIAGLDSNSQTAMRSKEDISYKDQGIEVQRFQDSEEPNFMGEYDFTELIEEAHANVERTNYFKERGLTDKTISKYKLGFVEDGLNFVQKRYDLFRSNPKFLCLYKYLLPVWDTNGRCTYFIPRLDEKSVPKHFEFMPSKTFNLPNIPVKIFNDRYLESCHSNIIFITEGIFDALSIEEFDFPCIALNGITNANKFLVLIEKHLALCRNKTFVLVPDNDDAGQKLLQKIKDGFEKLGINYQAAKLPEAYKDVNEYLQKDREGLGNMLNNITKEIESIETEANRKDGFVSAYLDQYYQESTENPIQPISSGFAELDNALSGGIIPGLYVLGAISSLGKTTFIHQIADNIAEQKVPVLFFSLEMRKKELVSKSLSRQTFLMDSKHAYSAIDFMKGTVPKEIFQAAINAYRQTAEYVRIEEGAKYLDVLKIRDQVKKFKEKFDKFVVFVDYLQIMQGPKKLLLSDKQTVDYNLTQLKQISWDFDVAVFVVSSFNRNNYNQTVSYESFKESGGIEYSADVVMALQLKDMSKLAKISDETTRRDEIYKLKAQPIRPLELVIIKQRNSVSFAKINFSYHARYNYFRTIPDFS